MRKLAAISVLVSLTLSASALGASPNGPERTVAELYKSFAWEAVMSGQPGAALVDQPESVLRRYFTPKLASALRADAQCAAHNHDICALDFSPIWDSQDPGAYDLEISQLGADRVLVKFKTPPSGKLVKLEYRMARQKQTWRVSDIVYTQGESLMTLLSGQ